MFFRFLTSLTILLISIIGFAQTSADAWINEIHYDNDGTDVNEGVEIVIKNVSTFPLANWSVIMYNGSGGGIIGTIDFSSGTTTTTSNGYTIAWKLESGIQNGPDAFALVYNNSVLVQFLSYEGSFTATEGLANGVTSTDIGVAESSSTLNTESLQLSGTGDEYSDFTWQSPAASTNGSLNNSQTLLACSTPDDVSATNNTSSTQQIDLSWTNGSCFDEILVVAKSGSSVTAVPSGDGSAYTANSNFSSGTEISAGEFVLYKGTGNAVSITGLTNGITYHYKIFSRLGTTWSTGISGNETPIAPTYGWQITSADTPFLIDFDNSVTNVNNGQFSGTGFFANPSLGQLNSSAWEITGLEDGNLSFDGTQTGNDFAKGTNDGGTNSGGLFAFEVETSNYALGFQSTDNDFTPGTITLKIQNQTGSTINSISLSYKVYEYNDQGRSSDLDFSYSTDNSSYSNISNIDFNSTEVADGNPVWKPTLMVTTISSLNITDGSFFYLRWTSDDVSGTGSRDEIAIDDISLVANPSTNTAKLGGEINNLTINGDVSLTSNLFIQNNLTFNSGKIELGSRNLTVLGNISGASSTNYILADGSGVVKQGVENGTPKTYPVGTSNYYIPITINQRGTADTISIRVEEQVYADGSSGTVQTSDALDVSWLIEEKTEGGSTVDLTVQWPSAAELSNFDPTACFFSHYRNGAWYPGTAQDVSGNDPRTITLTDVNSFSPFAIGSGNSPLPVELAYFRGNQFNNSVRLTWQTYAETGVESFLIKHEDENVAKVSASGNSNFSQNYEATIEPKSLNFPLIYELWEKDKNGQETKLAVTEINNLEKDGVYIEQTKNELTLRLDRSDPVQLQIFDIQGKLIIKEENLTQTKSYMLPQKGIYFITVFDDFFFDSQKIIQE